MDTDVDRKPVKGPGRTKVWPGHGWPYYARGAAKIAVFIGAFKFIEALIVLPPLDAGQRWPVAAIVSSKFWLAGAALGIVALLGWVSQRLFGWPAPEAPSPIQPARQMIQTPEMRLRMLGFNIVAGWVVLGVLALIIMADTDTGPFARIAMDLFGPNALSGLETFVLGAPVVAAPLVLLAGLPWLTRFPLLASMQATVKPSAKARSKRRKRP